MEKVILFELAVVGDAHPLEEVSTQLTTSEFANALLEQVLLFVPTLLPFSFHWYEGETPPFVGVAVKVTLVPEQTVLEVFAAILTEGVTLPVTLIVTVFELAVDDVIHAALEVRIHVTRSPFTNVLFE